MFSALCVANVSLTLNIGWHVWASGRTRLPREALQDLRRRTFGGSRVVLVHLARFSTTYPGAKRGRNIWMRLTDTDMTKNIVAFIDSGFQSGTAFR